MNLIRKEEDFQQLSDGNLLYGTAPELDNSVIQFKGKNNILYCENGVKLYKSSLKFNADNSVIYLGKSRHLYKLNISIYNNNVFHIGPNNYMTNTMTVILSEQKHCYIGDNGIFSAGIYIRNSDAHPIYDSTTGKRINPVKSVFIGDHVWIGQNAIILKDTKIDSGSIIGAGSVVAGKSIPHNESWAGNPCRRIAENIFWDGASTHAWTDDEIAASENYADYISKYKKDCSPDYWIYNYLENEVIDYLYLDNILSENSDAIDKLNILLHLEKSKMKNRFVHN